MEDVVEISYNEIDPVCDEKNLRESGEEILSSMQENDSLLLSFIVDSSIAIEKELDKYDHLVIVNKAWMERFDSLSNLEEIAPEETSAEMQEFFNAQMPVWTKSKVVFEDGIGLYEYTGDGLLAFPVNVGRTASAIETKNPLIIMVDEPVTSMNAETFLLPLSSSSNLVFNDEEKLVEMINGSVIEPYIAGIENISIDVEQH